MTAITNRYDFVVFFDVINGNPNGDPDAGNMPRLDPETNQGLVSDVCLKRKIRNFAEIAKSDESGFGIYVQDGSILNEQHRKAYKIVRGDTKETSAAKLNPQTDAEAGELKKFMCDNFFDVRTFGAVMSTGINCGQVRGPVQMTFARSVEAIIPLEISITRMAATNEKEKKAALEGSDESRTENRTMGRKHIIPYGLYRAHGFVSASLANKTGFSENDLTFLWEALKNMFEHDRSAARGEMSVRKLIVFKHDCALGNAPAFALFDRVTAGRPGAGGELLMFRDERIENLPPARAFNDYRIDVNLVDMPKGVEVINMI